MQYSLILFFLFLPVSTFGSMMLVDDFESGKISSWEEMSFKGNTNYTIVPGEDGHCLKATSSDAASGLIHVVEFDPREYPRVTWRWKVDRVIPGGDSRKRDADDYPARIYISFPHWAFFKTTSLNYIWANKLPKETFQPSIYTGNSIMIAVESGVERVGEWVVVERNVLEDYRRAFGQEAPRKARVAIMTDTDNTGASVSAYYDDIRLLSE